MTVMNALRGKTNYMAGLMAEESVERLYAEKGCEVLSQRFRAKRGEIDLIVRDGPTVVFVEVKKARNHAAAALRVTSSKMTRLWMAAEEFLARLSTGLMTDCRFDVALVDEFGRVELRENAFGGA
jgi:putative endonuclease